MLPRDRNLVMGDESATARLIRTRRQPCSRKRSTKSTKRQLESFCLVTNYREMRALDSLPPAVELEVIAKLPRNRRPRVRAERKTVAISWPIRACNRAPSYIGPMQLFRLLWNSFERKLGPILLAALEIDAVQTKCTMLVMEFVVAAIELPGSTRSASRGTAIGISILTSSKGRTS
jgi:hypothetical protein